MAGPDCLNRDGSTPHGGGALDHFTAELQVQKE
jgi:hypothetical protein